LYKNKIKAVLFLMVVREKIKMDTTISQDEIKSIIKATIIEVLKERPDLLQEAIERALEEVALCRAIKDGEDKELVNREEVFTLLDGKA
jgi:hypothetical protein